MLNLENTMGVYQITNTITGDAYIGQSVNIPRRVKEHFCVNSKPLTPVKEAVVKYGKENFSVTVLEPCEDKSMLYERELYWIEKLQPTYNVRMGGPGDPSWKQSEEVKERIRAASIRQWQTMPEETKAKIRKNLTGPGFGHAVSEETREKLRQANLGKKATEESKEKRKATFATKKANGWKKAKPDHPIVGHRIVCNETGKHYISIREAADDMGMCTDVIYRQMKGKTAKAKGYTFSREV